jgi:hypothetical protein
MHYPSSVSNFAALIRATFSHKGRREDSAPQAATDFLSGNPARANPP